MIAPPMRGPVAEPRFPTGPVSVLPQKEFANYSHAMKYPSILGRRSGAIEAWIIVKPPFMRPAPPIPATNRPTISIAEDCAAPQIAEPTLKIVKKLRNSTFELKRAYIFPVRGWKDALYLLLGRYHFYLMITYAHSWYAAPYQPTSSNELNSSVIYGIAWRRS